MWVGGEMDRDTLGTKYTQTEDTKGTNIHRQELLRYTIFYSCLLDTGRNYIRRGYWIQGEII